MSIGSRIKKRRIELNMTQEELAKKIGYTSRYAIYKIEQDARNLKQDKIKPIAAALETTVEYIMGWSDEDKLDISKLTEENKMRIKDYYNVLLKNQKGE